MKGEFVVIQRIILPVVLLICVLVSGTELVTAGVDEHTVGLWLFDEGRGDMAEDSSGRGHHGDVVMARWVEGKFGEALEFDNGAVEVPDAADLQLQEFALEAWINIPDQPGRHEIVIEKYDGALRNYCMNVQQNTSLIVGGFTENSTWTNCVGTANLTDGQWHHLAVTYDMENLCVYVDGILEKECPKNSLRPDVSTGMLSIGRKGGNFVTGMVDEVCISNIARSESEIKQSMKGQLTIAVEATGKLATLWGSLRKHIQ